MVVLALVSKLNQAEPSCTNITINSSQQERAHLCRLAWHGCCGLGVL